MRYAPSLIGPALLAAGLAACSPGDATAENTEAAETSEAAEADAAEAADTAETTETADAGTATDAADAGAARAPAPAPTSASATQTLAALPLKRGYYVSSDTPCGEASNATVVLVHRKGINSAHAQCAYKAIEPTGPNVYRVREACTELWGNAPPEEHERTFTLTGDTAFTAVSQSNGWVQSARYCAQSAMPSLWQENDISAETD